MQVMKIYHFKIKNMDILELQATENKIHYGFGKDYLPNWGIQQALREIYQNFLDYGDYQERTDILSNGDLLVTLSNGWKPESLDFLRIGKSMKHSANPIGKHGEGVKMAFLILEREELNSSIFTDKYIITPSFYTDKEIGECFSLIYKEHGITDQKFTIQFNIPPEEFSQFKDSLITEDDVIFSHEYGDIVDKEAGSIYSGNLFVVKVRNMTNAYNLKPRYLPLDRDRSVPRSFDVNYYSSKINSAHAQLIDLKSLSNSDTLYIDDVPDTVKEQIKPKLVGNSIEFVYKDAENKTVVISNESVKEILKRDSLFQAAIKRLKMFIAKKLGLYDLLIEFKEKHVHSSDAIADFELILERVKPV